MYDIYIYFHVVIAAALINVWLFRFKKKTLYRGGDANTMYEEFLVYGLPKWFMYCIGFLKISTSCLLVIGIWKKDINMYCYVILGALMLGAIIMHLKVKDPINKSLPAAAILILIFCLLGFNI